jgi:hypothetical protein
MVQVLLTAQVDFPNKTYGNRIPSTDYIQRADKVLTPEATSG